MILLILKFISNTFAIWYLTTTIASLASRKWTPSLSNSNPIKPTSNLSWFLTHTFTQIVKCMNNSSPSAKVYLILWQESRLNSLLSPIKFNENLDRKRKNSKSQKHSVRPFLKKKIVNKSKDKWLSPAKNSWNFTSSENPISRALDSKDY